MRPPNILYILLPLLTVTGALEVTMRTPDVTALRGENVTIPCQIRDLNSGSAISILWSRKSEDGTHHDVYEYNNGAGKAHRPGSSMKLTEVLNGNAELHLPWVQFSDEGEYSCTVINTPNKADGRATLQVSVPPSADVTPGSPTIEVGAEKTMMCEVYNFYPKDISIRWGQYRKGSSDCEFLEIWTCVKKVLNNSDGTYNVTSLLTLTPKMEDSGNIYSCIISHRSLLRTELSRNLTLTVTEREDNSGAIISAVLLTILAVIILGVLCFLYFRFIKKDPPTLSEITGNDDLIDMNRTTLTCQIMDFRPNQIEISVCMRRSREGEEERTIYTWRSGGLLTPVRISKDGGGGDEEVVDMEEGGPLMNGSAGHKDRPLQLEMIPLIRRRKQFGAFLCQCSLQITPSYDLHNGAQLSVRVNHPALTSPVSVRRILNVIGVPPKVLSIMSPDRVTHEERLTLTCPINGFKPRDLSITWLRREKNLRETQLLTWNSRENSIHREKYSHNVKKNEHDDDKSFSYISALILKPTIREDDGVTYICRTFHPATDHREEREQILNVTAVPVLESIVKTQDVVRVGEKLDLSCRIHSFYPPNIEVTWYTGDDIISSSHTTEPLPDKDGLYHVTSTSSYTPTMRDLGKKFRCEVQHASLSNPKHVEILVELLSPPTLGDIQCDPAQPEGGNTVTFSCTIDNMYPGNPVIQWYRGLTKLKSEDWKDKIQKGPISEIFSGTTELTFIPTSEDHGTPIRLEVTHSGKTFTKDYHLLLKGFYKLSEISSDPRNPDYGKPLTLRCDVIGCDPGDTLEVIWSGTGRDLEKGQQRETRGSGGVLSCYLTIKPTAQDYGKVYTCRVTNKKMENSTEKKIHLRLPERPPTLSDIVVHPMRVTANQEASFTVTISGYSPRDLQIKWYKEFCTFPQSEVTISDPEIGLDGLYKSSSAVTFTPKMSDDNATLRCEVTHSQSKNIREKRYTLHLTGESKTPEAPKPGPEKKFQIREIKCVTERPRVGEEVTLVAHIEECQADSAEFTWTTGMFPIDGEIQNKQDGPDCTSTITFTPEDSDTDCPIKLEVFYNYRTVEGFFTLPLV